MNYPAASSGVLKNTNKDETVCEHTNSTMRSISN